jgi:hypothetical protein
MKRKQKFYIVLLLFGALFGLFLGNLSCGNNSPTSPKGTPTNTTTPTGTLPTSTFTTTGTPTFTPTCGTYTSLTANIDGADFPGNDTGHTIPALILLDQGGTNVGDIFTFTLASPAILNFSTCPTADPSRDLVMYVRASCWSPAGEAYNDDTCDLLPAISGLSLPAGTYYILVAENTGSVAGPYVLRIKSGTLPPVATASPASTPTVVPTATYTTCTTSYYFGSLGTTDRVGEGNVDDSVNTDDYYSFKPIHSGPVTVILDSFDNGMGITDFDLYGFSDCPTVTSVGSSSGSTPSEGFTFTSVGGTTYYMDVNAFFGSGPYRLTIKTP